MVSRSLGFGLLVEGDVEKKSAEEFFQLFKIPIFPHSENNHYAGIVSNTLPDAQNFDSLILSRRLQLEEQAITLASHRDRSFPAPIPEDVEPIEEGSVNGKPVLSFNFDLFKYLDLLWAGEQPKAFSGFPTVDIIIDIIRDFLRRVTTLIEISPNPWDYDYCVALTHDVDHSSLSEHLSDPWFWTYLYRCSLFALYELIKRKKSVPRFGGALLGFFKGLLLPTGLVDDPWYLFHKYIELERKFAARSAFFFVPNSNNSGENLQGGKARWDRAVSYELEDLHMVLGTIRDSGWEVGSHWLDGWRDLSEAEKEKVRVEKLIGNSPCLGGRVHWLFRDKDTLSILDEAGCCYDSTLGYVDMPGFASGTLCPYRPLDCKNLIEIPLNIQDGVLLGKDRMHLSEEDAFSEIGKIISLAKRHGGTIGLLWHLSTLGPPYLWDALYERLLGIFREDGAWMEIPRKIVQWQISRRGITFELGKNREGRWVRIRSRETPREPFRVRIHGSTSTLANRERFEARRRDSYFDIKFVGGEIDLVLRGNDEGS